MRLSPHFTLAEMTKSQTALRRGIRNLPGAREIENLKRLAVHVLEPVRAHFNRPFTPSSGYRSPELDAALKGKKAGETISQHMAGEAVDFEIPGYSNHEIAEWISKNLVFDQLILEYFNPKDPSSGWVHVSLKRQNNRKQLLTMNEERVWLGFLKDD